FADHAREIGRRHLSAHRSLDDVADLFQVLADVARLLRQQRRVRRHAVDDAERGDGFDVFDASGVNEQFHDSFLTGFTSSPTPSTTTRTLSPSLIGPMPSGVPVEIISPRSSVMTKVTNSISIS